MKLASRYSVVLLTCASLLVAGGVTAVARAEAQEYPGPPLEQPQSQLDAALHCDGAVDNATKTPVLFVPGTTAEGYENFSFNYVAVLREQGFPVCTVDYPYRGWRDMQTSTENIVNAIRVMYERSGRKVATIGHSQGGLHPAWAARFWPDIADKLDDAISLGSPFQGSTLATYYCKVLGVFQSGCQESFWQFTEGSNWSRALTAQPIAAGPDFTSIYTRFDEFAAPGAQASELAGAAHVAVQDICPARPVEHFTLVVDNVAYALVLDALTHDGPADPSRISSAECTKLFMPLDYPGLVTSIPSLLAIPAYAWLGSPPWTWKKAEPPLRSYAIV